MKTLLVLPTGPEYAIIAVDCGYRLVAWLSVEELNGLFPEALSDDEVENDKEAFREELLK